MSHPPPPAQPAQQPPHHTPHRLTGRAAWRFALTCALAGPLLGYLVLALLLALSRMPYGLSEVEAVLGAALVGIFYLGIGILVAYLLGVVPATIAALLCLWWFNKHGELGRMAAAVAGLAVGAASGIVLVVATVALWGRLGDISITHFASVILIAITCGVCSLILAPVALRRARRD